MVQAFAHREGDRVQKHIELLGNVLFVISNDPGEMDSPVGDMWDLLSYANDLNDDNWKMFSFLKLWRVSHNNI